MAQWYRAFTSTPHFNGLPKDAVTNSWAFVTGGSGDRDLIAFNIDTRLTAFYTGIKDYLHNSWDWANSTVKVIDMLDDNPRFPFYEATLSITAPSASNNNVPPEVAMCLSFQGDRVSGVNMRRRRGRVYLGPLQMPSADYMVATSTLTDLIVNQASAQLLHPSSGLTDWAVYSPYTHHDIPVGTKLTKDDPEVPDLLPASFTVVTKCWCDNAFDTQRRRGISATARSTAT